MKKPHIEPEPTQHLNQICVERAASQIELEALPFRCNEDECFVFSSEFGLPLTQTPKIQLSSGSK